MLHTDFAPADQSVILEILARFLRKSRADAVESYLALNLLLSVTRKLPRAARESQGSTSPGIFS